MAKGTSKPGSTVTRKVSKGPGKGDTVEFVANGAGTQNPGKLVSRRVIKDVPPKGTQSSLPKGKKDRRKAGNTNRHTGMGGSSSSNGADRRKHK